MQQAVAWYHINKRPRNAKLETHNARKIRRNANDGRYALRDTFIIISAKKQQLWNAPKVGKRSKTTHRLKTGRGVKTHLNSSKKKNNTNNRTHHNHTMKCFVSMLIKIIPFPQKSSQGPCHSIPHNVLQWMLQSQTGCGWRTGWVVHSACFGEGVLLGMGRTSYTGNLQQEL